MDVDRGSRSSRPGIRLTLRLAGFVLVVLAVLLVAVLVVDPDALPAGARPWALPLAVVLAVLGALPHRPLRRTTAVPLGAAAVVGTLVAYVVIAAPSSRQAVATGPSGADVPASTTPVPTPPADLPPRTPVLGVSTATLTDLDHFIEATGTHPEVFDVFEAWSRNRPLDREVADGVAARGARLSITWEPWVPDFTERQPDFALARIIGGAHDAYIDMFAESVRAFGEPVTIRLMHEMNGNWYPWGTGVNGNRPGEFVAAWQHVRDRFSALGVTNVTWMWSPNAVYAGSAPLAPLYPGDGYVDAVGVSNYNWGDYARDGFTTEWMTFGQLFDESIAQLRALTARPLWISETGSSDYGGSRAAWLAEAFQEVRLRPDVAGIVWFNHVDDGAEVDWRIDQDAETARIWRTGFESRPRA